MDSALVGFCKRMKSIVKLFRFVEVCVLLVFLSWLSIHLPFIVKISGEYFRRVFALILSPMSIFLLGNAIFVTLLAKSGLFSSNSSSSIDNAVAEFYDELRSENPDQISPAIDDEVVYQDKEIICEENTKIAKSNENLVDFDDVYEKEGMIVPEVKEAKYCRSQSENLRRDNEEDVEMKMNELKLRRSETDIHPKEFAGWEEVPSEDDVSGEEFQRTIEAFIAKQVRFHREERLAVVLHGQA